MKVNKAIILVAGLNTRMMPIAKILPKSLFPIGNKPVIHYLVKECLDAGLKEIIIVTREKDQLIKAYFNQDERLDTILSGRAAKGKQALKNLKQVEEMAKHLAFSEQIEALGECHGLYQAKAFIKNEPIALLYGDYMYLSQEPAIKQLMVQFEKNPQGVIQADARYIFDENAFAFLDEMDFIALETESIEPLINCYPESQIKKRVIQGVKCDVGLPKRYAQIIELFDRKGLI